MGKYVFTKPEKSAVWKAHDHSCYWCGDVLHDLKKVTIDHLFPEFLLNKPSEWAKHKEDYALPDDFDINSFENWVPAHSQCNSSKGKTVYPNAPVMIKAVHDAGKKSSKAKRIYKNLCKSLEKSKVIAQIEAFAEKELVTREEIIAVFSETNEEAIEVEKIVDEIVSRLSPQWKIVSADGDIGIASDGKMAGQTYIGKDEPHYSWRCPTCGSMGPWSGARCLNCGHFSDD